MNSDGIPIRSTIDNNLTVQYSALITQLASKARSVVRDLDPQVNFFFFFFIIKYEYTILLKKKLMYINNKLYIHGLL